MSSDVQSAASPPRPDAAFLDAQRAREGGPDLVAALERTVEDQLRHLDALGERLEVASGQRRELHSRLSALEAEAREERAELRQRHRADVHARDEEIAWLRGTVARQEEELSWLRPTVERLERLESEIAWMQRTRLWRAGGRYWQARDALGRLLRGRS